MEGPLSFGSKSGYATMIWAASPRRRCKLGRRTERAGDPSEDNQRHRLRCTEGRVWVGQKRGWLSSNPAEDAKIEGRGKKRTREKYFLPEEIAAILNAALAVQGTEREHSKTTAAKHWVPWLCAYSGARVAEMIQLRKEDVRNEDGGGWVIRLNPEAGDIKTNHYRDVPVHEHLVSLGFIEFVQRAKPDHLFCDVGKDGTTAGPADGVYKRILTIVRCVVPDPASNPIMHGATRSRLTVTKPDWMT